MWESLADIGFIMRHKGRYPTRWETSVALIKRAVCILVESRDDFWESVNIIDTIYRKTTPVRRVGK